ncbi:hypothetical protein DM02DRAFT_630420, partial [Periconia macrospinosa]
KKERVYGPWKTQLYAWKDVGKSGGAQENMNPLTFTNADNWAWMISYNWYAQAWGWRDNGEYTKEEKDRELKRHEQIECNTSESSPELDKCLKILDFAGKTLDSTKQVAPSR